MLMICPQSVKNEIPPKLFSRKFWKFFSQQLYSKQDFSADIYQWILQKRFKNTYLVNHLQTAVSNVLFY